MSERLLVLACGALAREVGAIVQANGWEHVDGEIRLGAGVIVAAFGLFGVWAALAPLDEGVIAPGVVQTEARRKPIQHPV